MRIMGVDGGGTKTTAALIDESGRVLARAVAGVANARLLSDSQLTALFHTLQRGMKFTPDAVSLCLAGVVSSSDHNRVRARAGIVWPRARILTASDRESALMAGFGRREGIVVICGTGSSTFGMRRGRFAKCGGWGHVLGDRGSAYDIAVQALRAAVADYDRTGEPGTMGRMMLRALGSTAPQEWIEWAQQSTKADIAALATTVFAAAASRDPLAKAVIAGAAKTLTESAAVVARKLRWPNPPVCLSGGVFANQPGFARLVAHGIRRRLPRAVVSTPQFDGAVGAALLALKNPPAAPVAPVAANTQNPLKDVAAALTEQRNPRTRDIDRKTVAQLFDVMMNEESRTIPAIRARKRDIVACIESIIAAFRRGGRLFYVGAGTSGRVGVLDASECPPTFSVPPGMVQGILAGGQRALYASVEEAEDDPHAGAAAIRHHGVCRRDVVVGIAASGRTPFVLGALEEASRLGAGAYFLTFNPKSGIRNPRSKLRLIAVATGPEVVTGSTRLKAGTATKLILNMMTTISMIRLGKVVSNLMVDVKPTNEKLRDRACRIVMTCKGCDYPQAREQLIHANWNVKNALAGH